MTQGFYMAFNGLFPFQHIPTDSNSLHCTAPRPPLQALGAELAELVLGADEDAALEEGGGRRLGGRVIQKSRT